MPLVKCEKKILSSSLDDKSIRKELLNYIKEKLFKNKDVSIIEELGLLQGDSRIDIAVINGTFWGFEIKSDSDSLVRLREQVQSYSLLFDRITLVCGEKHLENVFKLVPDWWGVLHITPTGQFKAIHKGKKNPSPKAESLVQLLWKNEALAILKVICIDEKLSNKAKHELWSMITARLSHNKLKKIIYQKIKEREDWRSDCTHK